MAAFVLVPDDITKRVGSKFYIRVTLDEAPAGGVAGWAVAMVACSAPDGFTGAFAAPTLEDATLGIWLFTIDATDTAAWPAGEYHLYARRTSPNPDDFWTGYLELISC